MIRSVLAVLAGFSTVAVLMVLSTAIAARFMLPDVMKVRTLRPPAAYVSVSLLDSLLAAAVGGFVAATIAHRSPLMHAACVAGLVLVISLITIREGAISTQPKWYGPVVLVLAPVAALAGGYLQEL